jgi:hypothetical protein
VRSRSVASRSRKSLRTPRKPLGLQRLKNFRISWQIQIGRSRGSDGQRNHEASSNAEKHAEPAFVKRLKHAHSAPHLAAPSPIIENGPQNAG